MRIIELDTFQFNSNALLPLIERELKRLQVKWIVNLFNQKMPKNSYVFIQTVEAPVAAQRDVQIVPRARIGIRAPIASRAPTAPAHNQRAGAPVRLQASLTANDQYRNWIPQLPNQGIQEVFRDRNNIAMIGDFEPQSFADGLLLDSK